MCPSAILNRLYINLAVLNSYILIYNVFTMVLRRRIKSKTWIVKCNQCNYCIHNNNNNNNKLSNKESSMKFHSECNTERNIPEEINYIICKIICFFIWKSSTAFKRQRKRKTFDQQWQIPCLIKIFQASSYLSKLQLTVRVHPFNTFW